MGTLQSDASRMRPSRDKYTTTRSWVPPEMGAARAAGRRGKLKFAADFRLRGAVGSAPVVIAQNHPRNHRSRNSKRPFRPSRRAAAAQLRLAVQGDQHRRILDPLASLIIWRGAPKSSSLVHRSGAVIRQLVDCS